MKKTGLIIAVLLFTLVTFSSATAQTINPGTLLSNPWADNQLMSPATLARMISAQRKVHIYNIGVVQDIKGAVHIGAASKDETRQKFEQVLKTLPKDEMIVVYCGCCPFDRCPNIRPAFQLLKEKRFSKAYLLNLSTNLRTDWIDKGYPLATSDH